MKTFVFFLLIEIFLNGCSVPKSPSLSIKETFRSYKRCETDNNCESWQTCEKEPSLGGEMLCKTKSIDGNPSKINQQKIVVEDNNNPGKKAKSCFQQNDCEPGQICENDPTLGDQKICKTQSIFIPRDDSALKISEEDIITVLLGSATIAGWFLCILGKVCLPWSFWH